MANSVELDQMLRSMVSDLGPISIYSSPATKYSPLSTAYYLRCLFDLSCQHDERFDAYVPDFFFHVLVPR